MDEKTEWNGTGIKTERSVLLSFSFAILHFQSVHCPFNKTNGPFRFVKREFFWCLLYLTMPSRRGIILYIGWHYGSTLNLGSISSVGELVVYTDIGGGSGAANTAKAVPK